MKYAIIADIHGNLEAFQVVLEDIKAAEMHAFRLPGRRRGL